MQPDQTLSSQNPAIKKFIGNLEQSSTEPPSAEILENTIGQITWTYNDVGDFKGTCVGAFKEGKRWVQITPGGAYTDTLNEYIDVFAYFAPGDEDNIWIVSEYNGQLSNGQMSNAPIQILIYK